MTALDNLKDCEVFDVIYSFNKKVMAHTQNHSERIHVSPRVRLPDSDVSMDTAMPIHHPHDKKRNYRYLRRYNGQKTSGSKKQCSFINAAGMTVHSLCLVTLAILLITGILIINQFSDMIETRKAADTAASVVLQVKAENEVLESILSIAVNETAVAYQASQRLGLIAGTGAESVCIRVPEQYLVDSLVPASSHSINGMNIMQLGFSQ